MVPQSPLHNFTVAIEKPFMDEVNTKSGIKLYRDTTFNPEQYAQTNGEVKAVPRFLKKDMDVAVGDQLFFSYMVVMDWEQRERDTPVHRNLIFHKQEKHWKVDASQAYFRVRDDKIKMLNGYVLLNLLDAPEVQSTLIIPEYLKKQKMTGAAQVLASDHTGIAANDVVYFDHRFVESYELWGNEYFILKRERILAKA